MGINILLAIGSLVMFTTFFGSSNKALMFNSQLASQNEYYISALSYGQSVIEEAKTKAFKEGNFIGPDDKTEKVNGMDNANGKGTTSGTSFDDVDDYDGYRRRVNSPRAEGYTVSTSVEWVSETDLQTHSSVETNYKRMTVQVTSPFFPKIFKGGKEVPDTVVVAYVFGK